MYKVVYSKFAKQWMVVAADGIAQSAWGSRLTAAQTASSLNRSRYDNPRKC